MISTRNKQVKDGRFCSLTVHYLEQSRGDEVFDKRVGSEKVNVKNNITKGVRKYAGVEVFKGVR